MAKIKFVETDAMPVCQHCKKELYTIEKVEKIYGDFIKQRIVYLCPHCQAVLSIGYNNGITSIVDNFD